MNKTRVPKPFAASHKAKMRNKSFKEAFEHYSDTLSIGLNIRDVRKSAGFTQKELAARMGVTQQLVSRLESGEYENPTIETLSRVADVVGKKLVVKFD
jgi:DNA-binding XRE family transcriptional regulator